MSINAKWISKRIQVELPIGSSDFTFLSKFLRQSGYEFNKKDGNFKCVCNSGKVNNMLSTWHMKSTPHNTIINTFEGRTFPFEDKVRSIVYPVIPKCDYVIEGPENESDNVIKALFDNRFEIVDLTKGGLFQKYVTKNNVDTVLLNYKVNDSFRMLFTGLDKTSRSLLQAFAMS
jgi:hypothetical protein